MFKRNNKKERYVPPAAGKGITSYFDTDTVHTDQFGVFLTVQEAVNSRRECGDKCVSCGTTVRHWDTDQKIVYIRSEASDDRPVPVCGDCWNDEPTREIMLESYAFGYVPANKEEEKKDAA